MQLFLAERRIQSVELLGPLCLACFNALLIGQAFGRKRNPLRGTVTVKSQLGIEPPQIESVARCFLYRFVCILPFKAQLMTPG